MNQTSGEESQMQAGIEPLLTSARVGEILGVHAMVVERMAKRGEIPGVKVGKFWRYRASALVSWIQERFESNR